MLKKLVEIAGSYKGALARAAPNPNDPPEIAKVKDAVKAALEAGQLDRADELLAQLEKLEDAAMASRQLERAGTSAQRGQLAMTQLRYRDAARHFADAARHVPADRTDVGLGYLDQEAEALYRQGDERGDNSALRETIERYPILLTQRPRDRVPLDWAMTQNNLGAALRDAGRAGERDGASGGGGRGLSRGAGGIHARSGAAAMGDDADQPRHSRSEAWASGRAGRRVWRRRSRPFARRWRNTRASGCRCNGR